MMKQLLPLMTALLLSTSCVKDNKLEKPNGGTDPKNPVELKEDHTQYDQDKPVRNYALQGVLVTRGNYSHSPHNQAYPIQGGSFYRGLSKEYNDDEPVITFLFEADGQNKAGKNIGTLIGTTTKGRDDIPNTLAYSFTFDKPNDDIAVDAYLYVEKGLSVVGNSISPKGWPARYVRDISEFSAIVYSVPAAQAMIAKSGNTQQISQDLPGDLNGLGWYQNGTGPNEKISFDASLTRPFADNADDYTKYYETDMAGNPLDDPSKMNENVQDLQQTHVFIPINTQEIKSGTPVGKDGQLTVARNTDGYQLH